MSECPLCKFKGQLIQDQFKEIRYCQNNECPIIQYEASSITELVVGLEYIMSETLPYSAIISTVLYPSQVSVNASHQ